MSLWDDDWSVTELHLADLAQVRRSSFREFLLTGTSVRGGGRAQMMRSGLN